MTKLDAEFQELVAKMNTPASQNGIAALFSSTQEELGQAAVRGAHLDNERSGASGGQTDAIQQSQ